MTLPFADVWASIASDDLKRGVVRRRLRADLPHDVFLAESRPERRRSALLELVGPIDQRWRGVRKSRGIGVDITFDSNDVSRVRLTDEGTGRSGLFETIVGDLIDQLDEDDSRGALHLLCDRLIAWQNFLELASDGLSIHEQVGLFAELYVLSRLLDAGLPAETVVPAWVGPDPALQDFQHADLAIEVKASAAGPPLTVTIASDRQLDDRAVDRLYLVAHSVDVREGVTSEPGSLPVLTNALRARLVGTGVGVEFETSLLNAGYTELDAGRYDRQFEILETRCFLVSDGFPRIIPPGLPAGVGRVRYQLELDACTAWSCSLQDITDTWAEGDV